MATYLTNADALGWCLTAGANDSNVGDPNYSLGGARLPDEIKQIGGLIDNPISQVIIDAVGGYNGEGLASIIAASTTSLQWAPPGISVSSITRSGTTATVTCASVHSLTTGQTVVLSGADQQEYNGQFTVTVTSTVAFTMSVINSPTTPATGTILCQIFGAAVTIADGESKVIEGRNASQYIRITRDGTDDLPASAPSPMSISLQKYFNNWIGMDNVTSAERAAGLNTYRAGFMVNHCGAALTSIKVWLPTLGTARVSGSAQLGAAGSGTITTATANGFADWPTVGWCRIETSANAIREIVYYSSRTATSLTVPADGRARLGTSAAAGASTDNIYSVPGVRIALEAPATNGTIQTIANESTAPTGVTWNTSVTSAGGLSISTLPIDATYGIWVHRENPASGVYSVSVENGINWEFVYSGTTYSGTNRGCYRIADSSLSLYKAYVGDDANPNLSGSTTATSATLPFNVPIAPPGAGTHEFRLTVLQQNEYGLTSLNQYYRSFYIDSAGANQTPEISDPASPALTNTTGGIVELTARYDATKDTSPADTWLIYATTTGVDPNTGTDTPTEVSMTSGAGGFTFDGSYGMFGQSGTFTLRRRLGPYAWGTDLRVLLRARRDSDNEDSTNTTVLSTTVSTVSAPTRVSKRAAFLGGAKTVYLAAPGLRDTVYVDQPNNVFFRLLEGETQFWKGSTLIWRAVFADSSRARLHIPTAWALTNTTISGSGTATAHNIESTSSGNILYVIVNGQRCARIDVSNQLIESDTFTLYDTTTDCPAEGPTAGTLTQTVFTVFAPVIGRWMSYLSVDSAGLWKSAYPVDQIVS